MKLIIEGPDLSGKSTAIEQIAKFYNKGITIKNNYKPNKLNASNEIYLQYWKILSLAYGVDDIILDRFFPSQAVYSYLRGQDEMEAPEIIQLDNFCSKEWTYVYLATHLPTLKERYASRGDEHIKLDDLKVLKMRYDQFYTWTQMRKIRIYTTEPNWFLKLQNFLKEARK